jgi:hypothetical protein
MRSARSNCLFVIAILAMVSFPGGLRAEDQVTANERFGEWRIECAVDVATRKSCSIWAGPLRAWRVSRPGSGESADLTLFVDPPTAYASVAARPGLFAQFQVDRNQAFFADCDLGVCQLSKREAESLFDEMYNGNHLQIRIAASEGVFDNILDLSAYKSALDTYLDEERTYELTSSNSDFESAIPRSDANDRATEAPQEATSWDQRRDPKLWVAVVVGIVAFLVAYGVLALGEALLATLVETKNGGPRHVFLNDVAYQALKSVPSRIDDERLFPFTPNQISLAFQRAVRRAGIEDLRLHDLPHTFAGYKAMSGVQGRGLRALLGHKDARMTLRYSHLSDGYLRSAVKNVILGSSARGNRKLALMWPRQIDRRRRDR